MRVAPGLDRDATIALVAGLAAVILLLPLLRSVSAEPIVLKVGISEPVNTVLAIWMADAAGFYEATGIKLEIINMNGGSRGAAELAAGRIDAMHVGLSSVVRLNRTGGDLRIVASLANVIRFTFFSGAGRQDRGRPQGRRGRREQLRLGKRFHGHAGAQAARPQPRRCHAQGIRRRPEAPCRREVGRDQGHRGQRAVLQHGARAGLQRAVRSRAGADPLAVHRHRGQARRHRGPPRRADAVHPRDRRGQLSRAHRREQGQGGAGQDRPASPIRKSSTSATTTSSCSRRRTSSRPTRPRKTSSRSSPMRARRSRTTSTAASSTACARTACSRRLAQKYRR